MTNPVVDSIGPLSSSGSITVATLNVQFDSSATPGTRAYLFWASEGGLLPPTPAGWAVEFTPTAYNGNTLAIGLFSKQVVPADPGTTVALTLSAKRSQLARILTITGNTDNVSVISNQTVDQATNTIPAITPVANDCLRFEVAAVSKQTVGTTVTTAQPGGWTEDIDDTSNHPTNRNVELFVAHIALSGQAGVAQGATASTPSATASSAVFSLTVVNSPSGAAALSSSATMTASAATVFGASAALSAAATMGATGGANPPIATIGANATSGSTTTTVLNPQMDPGATVGDTALLLWTEAAGLLPTVWPPSGWTNLITPIAFNSNTVAFGAATKIVAGGDPGSTWAITTSAARVQSARILTMPGVIDVLSGPTVTTTNQATDAAPALTPTFNDELLLVLAAVQVQTIATNCTSTPPAAWATDVNDTTTQATTLRNVNLFVGHLGLSGQGGIAQPTFNLTPSQSAAAAVWCLSVSRSTSASASLSASPTMTSAGTVVGGTTATKYGAALDHMDGQTMAGLVTQLHPQIIRVFGQAQTTWATVGSGDAVAAAATGIPMCLSHKFDLNLMLAADPTLMGQIRTIGGNIPDIPGQMWSWHHEPDNGDMTAAQFVQGFNNFCTQVDTVNVSRVNRILKNPIYTEGMFHGDRGDPNLWWPAGRAITDGVLNSTTTITSATAAFAAKDVNNIVAGTGIPIGARIVTVTNSTTVVLSAAATATASSVHLTIGGADCVGNDLYSFSSAIAPGAAFALGKGVPWNIPELGYTIGSTHTDAQTLAHLQTFVNLSVAQNPPPNAIMEFNDTGNRLSAYPSALAYWQSLTAGAVNISAKLRTSPTLSASAILNQRLAAALSAAAQLGAAASTTPAGSAAAFSSLVQLTAAGFVGAGSGVIGTAALSAAANLTVAGVPVYLGAAALSASPTLTAVGAPNPIRLVANPRLSAVGTSTPPGVNPVRSNGRYAVVAVLKQYEVSITVGATLKQNDLTPALTGFVFDEDSGVGLDLSGASSLRFTMVNEATGVTQINALATILPGTGGGFSYQWQPGDTATVGRYACEVKGIWPTGLPLIAPTAGTFEIVISQALS